MPSNPGVQPEEGDREERRGKQIGHAVGRAWPRQPTAASAKLNKGTYLLENLKRAGSLEFQSKLVCVIRSIFVVRTSKTVVFATWLCCIDGHCGYAFLIYF
ncbi:hypothetical protein NDU88_006003 [Pleurodeles waltl]|uniref:Uncharacterized protein n=1 Tax=Pleurodeles waltl TaxID=8319 RepID=A0AAV7PKA5_PLEWA|nr:hypothetical protein NDU88_006003 [Pleurodeles waltl]